MNGPRTRQSAAQSAALDQAYRSEQRRKWLQILSIAVVSIGLAGGYLWFTAGNGPVVTRNQMEGTVLNWTRSQSYTGASTLFVTVRLANGRQVTACSEQSLAPKAGSLTTVQENIYESGARAFVWPSDRL